MCRLSIEVVVLHLLQGGQDLAGGDRRLLGETVTGARL